MNIIFRLTQNQCFLEEFKSIKNVKSVSPSSELRALNPFIDSDNLIRVGGRIMNSNLSYFEKHLLVLPKTHHITDLIIHDVHNIHNWTTRH